MEYYLSPIYLSFSLQLFHTLEIFYKPVLLIPPESNIIVLIIHYNKVCIAFLPAMDPIWPFLLFLIGIYFWCDCQSYLWRQPSLNVPFLLVHLGSIRHHNSLPNIYYGFQSIFIYQLSPCFTFICIRAISSKDISIRFLPYNYFKDTIRIIFTTPRLIESSEYTTAKGQFAISA